MIASSESGLSSSARLIAAGWTRRSARCVAARFPRVTHASITVGSSATTLFESFDRRFGIIVVHRGFAGPGHHVVEVDLVFGVGQAPSARPTRRLIATKFPRYPRAASRARVSGSISSMRCVERGNVPARFELPQLGAHSFSDVGALAVEIMRTSRGSTATIVELGPRRLDVFQVADPQCGQFTPAKVVPGDRTPRSNMRAASIAHRP